jgi:hypothetical protein
MVKEGVLFSLDRGHSMLEGEGQSAFELSLQCVLMGLQQRVFNNTDCECGLAIFGDEACEQDGDGHNLLLSELAKPGLELVRNVGRMRGLKRSDKKGGDLFESLHFCANELA